MNPLNPVEFRRQGHMVIDFLADYYENIEKYPVRSHVKPGYLFQSSPDCAPMYPEPIEAILKDVQKDIIPGITHWQSPNFFAYFASSANTASFLGEMLLNGFNVVGFNWASSPAATELEILVMEWLLKLLQLPQSFSTSSDHGGGVLLGTTCEAFVCTLLAAKEKTLDQIGRENTEKLAVYCSDQTHFSFQKSAKIIGIKPENVRQVVTNRTTNFELSPESLDEMIKRDLEDGLIPIYLCATVGTTSTTAVDPLGSLCEVASKYNMWVHVDAAYAGSACICPEFRHFLDGVEGASSFSFNAHKWLLPNLACCCLWVKDKSSFTKPLSTTSELIANKTTESGKVVDYKDWQISLARRFQALKLWMVLRSYGTIALREYIRKHVKMAKDFEGLVNMDSRFEIMAPRYFSMVCFRVSPYAISQHHDNDHEANEFNQMLLELVNATGRVYMTHSVVGGVYVIRFAVGATLTEDRHVKMAWELVQGQATSLLGTPTPNSASNVQSSKQIEGSIST
ncbi:tyrosine decarboxylase 1-like [Lactuca sativa]|uniref:tyrosine decarboxylase 1 n=1 Tax=Lactuca sativa TaxID=4236 RepID=UPI000CBA1131|nr:tyrosine decarboxylase 1 [Lactuca sativa]XP_052627394.1 tyrosine decarboxylase 1-like [Lactuca sativa]